MRFPDFLLRPRIAFLLGGGVSASLLAGAHLFEHVGGLAPCLLCLEQREVHWTALGVAGLGLAVSYFLPARQTLRITLFVLAAVFLASAILGGYHAGVEWDFWEGPQACAGGGGELSLEDFDPSAIFTAELPAGPPCKIAAWRMLGISMAGYNALISLALALFVGAAALRVAPARAGADIKG